jgi:hypothetical protein
MYAEPQYFKLMSFEHRVNSESVEVIDNLLGILKLNRSRPGASGARVAAIGRLQDKLEAERQNIWARIEAEQGEPQPEEAAA